jgi:hypothetical protein
MLFPPSLEETVLQLLEALLTQQPPQDQEALRLLGFGGGGISLCSVLEKGE